MTLLENSPHLFEFALGAVNFVAPVVLIIFKIIDTMNITAKKMRFTLLGLILGAAFSANAWEAGDVAAWQSGTFEWDDAKAWNKVWNLETNNWKDLDQADRVVPSTDVTLKLQWLTVNVNDGQQIVQKSISGAYQATLNIVGVGVGAAAEEQTSFTLQNGLSTDGQSIINVTDGAIYSVADGTFTSFGNSSARRGGFISENSTINSSMRTASATDIAISNSTLRGTNDNWLLRIENNDSNNAHLGTNVTLENVQASSLNQGVGSFISLDLNGKDAVTNVKLNNVTFDGVTDAQFNGTYVTGGSNFVVYASGENSKTSVEILNSDLQLENMTFGHSSNSSSNAGTIDVLIKGTSQEQKTTILAKNLEVHNSRAESPNAGYSTKVTVTDYVKLDVADVNVGYANSNLSGQAILNIGDNVEMTLNSLNVRNSTMADSGSYALFEIGSNTTITGQGALNLGSSGANSGDAIIRFSGENSSLSTSNFQTNNGVKNGGSVLFEMLGKNNSYYNAGDFNINGYTIAAVSGGSAGVVVAGEGNTLTSVKRIHIGLNDKTGDWSYTGAKAYFHASSSSAENVAKINVLQFSLGLSGAATAQEGVVYDATSELFFLGNTKVRGSDGVSAVSNIYVGTSGTSLGGTATMKVSGSNNDILVSNLQIGNSDEGYSKTSKSELIMQGSGNTLKVSNLRLYANSSFVLGDNAGGWISFIADSDGFSTIEATTTDIASGFISIDLSSLSGIYENEKFTLISCENSIGLNESNIKITLRDGDEDGAAYIYIDPADVGSGYELNLYYTSYVPEPAEIAAIFGALALALSAYKRRRRA